MPSDITLEKNVPHSLDAERSVLGAILVENHAINRAQEILREGDGGFDLHVCMMDPFRCQVNLERPSGSVVGGRRDCIRLRLELASRDHKAKACYVPSVQGLHLGPGASLHGFQVLDLATPFGCPICPSRSGLEKLATQRADDLPPREPMTGDGFAEYLPKSPQPSAWRPKKMPSRDKLLQGRRQFFRLSSR